MDNTKPKSDSQAQDNPNVKEDQPRQMKRVSFRELFRYLKGFDKFLFILGVLSASFAGLSNVAKFLIFRWFMDKLDTNKSNQEKAGNA